MPPRETKFDRMGKVCLGDQREIGWMDQRIVAFPLQREKAPFYLGVNGGGAGVKASLKDPPFFS